MLALIPFIFLSINSVWLSNLYGDVDTWIYHGYFYQVVNGDSGLAPLVFDYTRTRLAYILPGALVYGLLSDGAAKIVFNLLVIYPTIVGSFWFVLKINTSRPIAFAGASMLASDIYVLRTIGWQYIDNGVLAYEALTFAFLTAASRSLHPARWQAVAGFTAGAMIFTHLGSAILVPVFAAYALLMQQGETAKFRGMFLTAIYAVIGLAAAFIALSLLNALIYKQSFFFMIYQQLKIVSKETGRSVSLYNQPLSELRERGFWLAVPGAVMISSFVVLVLSWRRWLCPFRLTFESFCLLTTAFLFLAVLILEGMQKAFLLSRQGEYINFFSFSAYLSVAVLALRFTVGGWRAATAVAVLFASSAAVRLSMNDGLGIAEWLKLPMVELAMLIAIPLAAPALLKNSNARFACVVLLAVITTALPCHFFADRAVEQTERRVRQIVGGESPHFYFDRHDIVGNEFYMSVVASFAERAIWEHGENYPDFKPAVDPLAVPRAGDLVVVLGTGLSDADSVKRMAENAVGTVEAIGQAYIPRSQAPIWIYGFRVGGQSNGQEH